MRVGLDLIEIARIRRALERYPDFRDRCFTRAEQEYCDAKANPAQHYAGRFAAKEAVGKELGVGVDRRERREVVLRARLPEHRRLDLGGVLEPGDEGARVEARALGRLPPAVLVQAVEIGAAEQHGVRPLADELDPVEVLDDRVHRQREHALPAKRRGRRARRRLQLLVVELDPVGADLVGERAS